MGDRIFQADAMQITGQRWRSVRDHWAIPWNWSISSSFPRKQGPGVLLQWPDTLNEVQRPWVPACAGMTSEAQVLRPFPVPRD
jgi:hypothetical protein